MAYRDLRTFIAALEQRGLLRRVSVEVDPILEIAEITDRISKRTGPALLFERVKGSRMPVAINLFGSYERMCLALEVRQLDEIADRIVQLTQPNIPGTFMEKLAWLPKLQELASAAPKVVGHGPCQEVVRRDGTFDECPILQCWPKDAGRYITMPQVITRDPKTGQRNVGMYRLQVLDTKRLVMHWQIHKDAAQHYAKLGTGKRQMPVAIAIGGDPACVYSASAPLPPFIDEYLFAGFLRKTPVELVKCQTIDLDVPAHAEMVFEGYVDVDEQHTEGPFGDHTGVYSPPGPYPVFHLTCVTHRKDPIYLTTIVGVPPMEDFYLGKATERIFLPLIKTQLPEVVDINFPAEGIFNNCVLVSIDKQYPFQARKVAHAMWGLGQLMFTKMIVLFDKDVDVQNLSQAAFWAMNHIDPKRDCFFVEGPVDTLNHAAPMLNVGSKIGIDATRKWKEEGYQLEWPDPIVMPDELKRLVDRRWREYGLDHT